jgi:hypothetical protein
MMQAGNATEPVKPRWYTRAGLLNGYRGVRDRIREKFEISELRATAMDDPFEGRRAVKELARKGRFDILADVAVSASDSKNAGDATYALFRHGLRNELAFVVAYAEKAGIRRFAERLAERQTAEPEEA